MGIYYVFMNQVLWCRLVFMDYLQFTLKMSVVRGVELCWEGETVYLSVISDPDKSSRFWSMSAAEIEPLVDGEKYPNAEGRREGSDWIDALSVWWWFWFGRYFRAHAAAVCDNGVDVESGSSFVCFLTKQFSELKLSFKHSSHSVAWLEQCIISVGRTAHSYLVQTRTKEYRSLEFLLVLDYLNNKELR